MTPAEIESHRRNREAEVRAAWEVLALNPSFKTVWEKDLQSKFNPLKPSFRSSDGHNTHAAAIRDGEKIVIAHIAKRLALGVAMLDEEDISKPAEAPAEFQGVQP
jgi:hypothetical protein